MTTQPTTTPTFLHYVGLWSARHCTADPQRTAVELKEDSGAGLRDIRDALGLASVTTTVRHLATASGPATTTLVMDKMVEIHRWAHVSYVHWRLRKSTLRFFEVKRCPQNFPRR